MINLKNINKIIKTGYKKVYLFILAFKKINEKADIEC